MCAGEGNAQLVSDETEKSETHGVLQIAFQMNGRKGRNKQYSEGIERHKEIGK